MRTNNYVLAIFITVLTAGCVWAGGDKAEYGEAVQFTDLLNTKDDPFFDTRILGDPKKMAAILKEHGFQEGNLTTSDKLSINYLYLERPDATHNVVCAAGWSPGRKEGMSTFYRLLSDKCNIMLFDARGHGTSEGSKLPFNWRTLSFEYGLNEYQDMIGVLQFLRDTTHKPTFIHGICAGAFNGAHALAVLQKEGTLEQFDVKGFIFDSGWGSVLPSSRATLKEESSRKVRKSLRRGLGHLHDNYVMQTMVQLIGATIGIFMYLIHRMFLQPLYPYESRTALKKQMKMIPTPVLFIHGIHDKNAPIKQVVELAEKTEHAECWWIDGQSRHGCHHLKHTDEYHRRLSGFIQEGLSGSA